MKLHVSYNVFDGEELLRASIENIRNHVDSVSIVYQTTSHYNQPCSPYLLDVLSDIVNDGLVESVIEFTVPEQAFTAMDNYRHPLEAKKREIGLEYARKTGCTHYMSCDIDEFYKPDEFEQAKDLILSEGYDATACRLYNFYKNPRWINPHPAGFYVPFIHKIYPMSHIEVPSDYFCYVDPTRKMRPYKKPYLFDETSIAMYHYTSIRLDMARKFQSHNGRINFVREFGEDFVEALVEKYDDLYMDGDTTKKEVDDYFGIEESLNKFIKRYVDDESHNVFTDGTPVQSN